MLIIRNRISLLAYNFASTTGVAVLAGNVSSLDRDAWEVLDALPDPLILLRPVRDDAGAITDMQIIAANDAVKAVVPPTMQPFVGLTLTQAFPERADLFDHARQVAESGEPLSIDRQEVQIPGIGATRTLAVRVVPVGTDVCATWRDVTAFADAFDEIQESEHRSRMLAENAADVVLMRDAAGIIQWVSPSVETLLGWSAEELEGTDILDAIHPHDRHVGESVRNDVARGVIREGVVVRIRAKNGTFRHMSVVSRRLSENGVYVGASIGLRDVDAQVRAQQAAQDAAAASMPIIALTPPLAIDAAHLQLRPLKTTVSSATLARLIALPPLKADDATAWAFVDDALRELPDFALVPRCPTVTADNAGHVEPPLPVPQAVLRFALIEFDVSVGWGRNSSLQGRVFPAVQLLFRYPDGRLVPYQRNGLDHAIEQERVGRELVGQRLRNVRVESQWEMRMPRLLYTADRIEPSLAYARDIKALRESLWGLPDHDWSGRGPTVLADAQMAGFAIEIEAGFLRVFEHRARADRRRLLRCCSRRSIGLLAVTSAIGFGAIGFGTVRLGRIGFGAVGFGRVRAAARRCRVRAFGVVRRVRIRRRSTTTCGRHAGDEERKNQRKMFVNAYHAVS